MRLASGTLNVRKLLEPFKLDFDLQDKLSRLLGRLLSGCDVFDCSADLVAAFCASMKSSAAVLRPSRFLHVSLDARRSQS